MLSFTSAPFFLFVLILFVSYRLLPKQCRPYLLLIASLAFYISFGWENVFFLLATVISSWLGAMWIDKKYRSFEKQYHDTAETLTKEERKNLKKANKKKALRICVLFVIFNIAVLCVLKYSAFAVSSVQNLFRLSDSERLTPFSLFLPLGISFYTFRACGYVIDVYRRQAPFEKNIAKYALFVSFFPAIVQGPICHYNDLAPSLFSPRPFCKEDAGFGFLRVLWGYIKKLVVADTAMVAVKAIVQSSGAADGMYVLLLIIVYSAVIYGDFTGGMDISIGLSQMLGITLTENFNHPFCSRNIEEYWKRWHITMGTWFETYVFHPLAQSDAMTKLYHRASKTFGVKAGQKIHVYLCMLITWFLTGLWHGASWNFIVWGVLNGLIIILSNECKPLYLKFHKRHPDINESRVYYGFCCVRTFFVVGFVRILDVYRDVPDTARAWWSMVSSFSSWADLFNGRVFETTGVAPFKWIVILACVIVFAVVGHFTKSNEQKQKLSRGLTDRPWLWALSACAMICVIVLFGSYGIGYDSQDFIYTQF